MPAILKPDIKKKGYSHDTTKKEVRDMVNSKSPSIVKKYRKYIKPIFSKESSFIDAVILDAYNDEMSKIAASTMPSFLLNNKKPKPAKSKTSYEKFLLNKKNVDKKKEEKKQWERNVKSVRDLGF